MGEDIDIERPLGQELDVLEIALEFVELSQDIRAKGTVPSLGIFASG